MLKRFEVTNFKNFRDTKIFDFGDVHDYHFNEECVKNKILNKAIIYGKNSVGKTNLGYALFDITFNFNNYATEYSAYQDSYLNADSEQYVAQFKYVFQFEDTEVIYEYQKHDINTLLYEKLVFNDKTVLEYSFVKEEMLVYDAEALSAQTLNWEFSNINMSVVKYIANNTFFDKDHPLLNLVTFVSRMVWFRALELNRYIGVLKKREGLTSFIINNELVDEFEKFLNVNGVDEKIIVKDNGEGNPELYFAHKQPISFSKTASSGTRSLTAIFFWIKHIEDYSFIWIDEYDAFFHYEVSDNLIKVLRDYIDVQVVLTTHNTNIMSNRYMRPDCYFILSKHGLTSLCNATERELREGHNLQKMYLSGEFDEE